ncbi:ogr/Delta-like zinc finger family protein [Acerihabitans arboris]|uniref:Transcriptional regulator n=1 Tax=Acerihabitans arboris TaxID=2691583 RepID=A0A845SQF8_9GAMM|nr:ogr/Delta-like zinc finger family protein [Acerihabitans arboris]NDL64818.1 transcriptional regulator [Acerihabitans arboris]
MRVMKVFCPECGSAANIRKTNRKDVHLSDLYCQCSDVECSHSFVLNVTFSHTISPSAKTGNGLVRSLLNLIQPKDRQMALDLLQGRV